MTLEATTLTSSRGYLGIKILNTFVMAGTDINGEQGMDVLTLNHLSYRCKAN